MESEDTRRNWRGRMRGEEEGVLVGVVEGVFGSVWFDLTGDERMERVAAGRPVRNREVVFMLAGSIRIAAVVELDIWSRWSKWIGSRDDWKQQYA